MDVNKPDIKALLGKLSFLRNHLNMLVPILIALVSVVPFVLAGVVGNKLQEKVAKDSLSQGRQLKNLAAEAVPEKQWIVERDAMRDYIEDANRIEEAVRQGTLRPLLSTKIFPTPKDKSQALFDEYKQAYLDGIEAMVKAVGGRDCPSESELGSHASGLGMGGAMGGAGYGEEMMMGAYGEGGYGMEMEGYGMPGMGSASRIVDAICLQRAREARVYVNPESLAGYRFWFDWLYENEEWALEDSWYWQLGYWIIEDVFETIGQCNDGSLNVLSSPVKRLKDLRFARVPDGTGMGMGGEYGYGMEYMMMDTGRGTGSDSDEVKPKYAIKKPDAITQPLTLRMNSELIHVVHFGMAVVVDARKVLWFMEQLCSEKTHVFKGFDGDQPPREFKRNQITILESSARSFQQEMGPHMLYRYGNNPVVELNLVCEYVFDANAYQPIVPEVVANTLLGEEEEQF